MGGLASNSAKLNIIEYITIANTGNTTDFGDLTIAKNLSAACSSATVGLSAGGLISGGQTNSIDKVTIGSTGNGSDFGDLVGANNSLAGCSNSHGGIAA